MYIKSKNKISQVFLKYELVTKKTRNYINQLPSIIKYMQIMMKYLLFKVILLCFENNFLKH